MKAHRDCPKYGASKTRARHMRRKYGLTESTHDSMLAEQGGVCAICKAPSPDSVDHCHGTGRVRGILCRRCNAGLGYFRDQPALMRKAARYLRAHAAKRLISAI